MTKAQLKQKIAELWTAERKLPHGSAERAVLREQRRAAEDELIALS